MGGFIYYLIWCRDKGWNVFIDNKRKKFMTSRSACYDRVIRRLTSSLWLLKLNLPDCDLTDRRLVRTRVDWRTDLNIISTNFYLLSRLFWSLQIVQSVLNDGIFCLGLMVIVRHSKFQPQTIFTMVTLTALVFARSERFPSSNYLPAWPS